MPSIHEVVRRIKERQPDPRKEEARKLTLSLQEKMRQVAGGAHNHPDIVMQLDQQQSEKLFPSEENAPPVDFFLSSMGDDGFICTFTRGQETSFRYNLIKGNPSIRRWTAKQNPEYPWELKMPESVTGLEHRNASKIERQLQALRFGHKIADFLLEVKGKSAGQVTR